MNKFLLCGIWAALGWHAALAQQPRKDYLLNDSWYTVANDSNATAWDGFEKKNALQTGWQKVQVPHTWDRYEGYRQLKHGNRHGYAWYQKAVTIERNISGKRVFLWFEGVNSFATVWVNGVQAGKHAGGRTSFTLDVTHLVKPGVRNIIAVKAEHPPFIRTLPWVCGGCSEEQGFSEGSQPMGIFRPVHLIVTSPVRVEPFGLHIWNDTTVWEGGTSQLHYTAEIKNYGSGKRKVIVETSIEDHARRVVYSSQKEVLLNAQQVIVINNDPQVKNTRLWSPEQPYLYRAVTRIRENGVLQDEETASFGVRRVSWPELDGKGNRQLRINGKPVFLNGTAEYEHILGSSHALSETEIYARARQVRAAGFNSFRDAHQPHNLRYQQYWDSLGILWWPQFSAHIWFDLPEFTFNFKQLMRDWIKERRNSPSIILWGLQNESTLPEYFAKECSDIIREMDPGATVQRKITTCNGGTGTDWNVPQNWTGTYGGNPADYGNDLMKQLLVGEYGAWRSIDLHTEGGFDVKGPLSEDRMTQLMEMKVRLADSVQTQTTGHYHWLLYSHDNPGRVQPDEGYRYIDKVGPVNNKGLFTIWGEPTDAFYMYRSNYTSAATDPMVYIVSHTWPERWMTPGIKSGIVVYSNCDEVELFNDREQRISLGRRRRGGAGTHFQWDSVPVKYNVLYAKGYYKGKAVAEDEIQLLHLPAIKQHLPLQRTSVTGEIHAPQKGIEYLMRVNCGGGDYLDQYGNTWWHDASEYSWANSFPGMNSRQASQRRTFDALKNTTERELFNTYRYGREELEYELEPGPGDYLVELYFLEPWYGIGGGMDCTRWRVFDVAINDKVVLKDLDIWKEAGTNKVLKKTFWVHAKDNKIVVRFPKISSSQAVIAAIAIGKKESKISASRVECDAVEVLPKGWSSMYALDKGNLMYADAGSRIHYLPAGLYGDCWMRTAMQSQPVSDVTLNSPYLLNGTELYVAMDKRVQVLPGWLKGFQAVEDSLVSDANGGTVFRMYKREFSYSDTVNIGANGTASDGEAQMYLLIFHKPTAWEKAEKIKRPVVTYPAAAAVQKGAGIDSAIAGYSAGGYVKMRAQTDTVSWKITVGVGDTYELRFRYRTETDKQVPVWLTVRLQDGTLMRHDKVFFAPANTKWKTLYSSTGTNINAGTYTVQLVPVTAETGVLLDKLEVQ